MSISGRHINQIIGISGQASDLGVNLQTPTPIPTFYNDTGTSNGSMSGRYTGMEMPWGDDVDSNAITHDAEWIAPFDGRVVFSQWSIESDGLFDEAATMKTILYVNPFAIGHENLEIIGKVLEKALTQRVSIMGIGDSNVSNNGGGTSQVPFGLGAGIQYAAFKEIAVTYDCWIEGPFNGSSSTSTVQHPMVEPVDSNPVKTYGTSDGAPPSPEYDDIAEWYSASHSTNYGFHGNPETGSYGKMGFRTRDRRYVSPEDRYTGGIFMIESDREDADTVYDIDPTWWNVETAGSFNDSTYHLSYFNISGGGILAWRVREYGSEKGSDSVDTDSDTNGNPVGSISSSSVTVAGGVLDNYTVTQSHSTNRIEMTMDDGATFPCAWTNMFVEFPNRPTGLHIGTISAEGGHEALKTMDDLALITDVQKAELFRRIAELSGEDDPQMIIYTSMGGNDFSSGDSVTGPVFKTQVTVIMDSMRVAWADAGLNPSGLVFALLSYQPMATSTNYGHRSTLKEIAKENSDTAFFDVETEWTLAEFIAKSWYNIDTEAAPQTTSSAHISRAGYLNVSQRFIETSIIAAANFTESTASDAIGTTGDNARLTGYNEWPDTATFLKGDVLTFNYEISTGNGIKFPMVTNYIERTS